MKSTKPKCLVTGAAGFIGSRLVTQLQLHGYDVRGLLLPNENRRNLFGIIIEEFTGNLLDKDSLKEAVQGVDYVFHTASLYTATPFYEKNNAQMEAVNIEGTRNLLEACVAAKVKKIVYTGSTGAVGLKDDLTPAGEDVELNHLEQRSEYEMSKARAEKLVLSYRDRLEVVSVVPSFLIGPGDMRPSPTGEVIIKYLNGRYPCYFDGLMCVSDLFSTVRAHLSALEKGKNGERYIVTVDEHVTVKEFFDMLHDITGIKPPLLKLPKGLLKVVAMLNEGLLGLLGLRRRFRPLISYELLRYFCLGASYDSSKAKAELGFKPEPLRAVTESAVKWFMLNGKIKKSARIRYYRHIGRLK